MRANGIGALCLVVTWAGACDPPARSEGGAAAHGAQKGRELESCGRTADCGEGLRCVAAVCTPEKVSGIGEYLWASARRAAQRGQTAVALEAFQKAAAQYESDKLVIPAGLLCDHGALLAHQAGDARAGEQAARLLHRCLLASPPGSRQHELALGEIVELAPRGLDATLFARDTPADAYLTNPPTAPSAESLKVEVARTTPAADKGYEAFAKLLEGPEARGALTRCWQERSKKTGKPELVVALALKLRAKLDDKDAYTGGTLEIAGDDESVKCLRSALAPQLTAFGKSGSTASWQGVVTVTMTGG